MNHISKIADAILNDIRGGLKGYHHNMSISREQLELEIIDMRLLIIKEYISKGVIPFKDLLISINCIEVDCKSLDKCPCNVESCGKPVAHFQIPQLLFDVPHPLYYVGSTDKSVPFLIYTSPYYQIKRNQKYRKRGKNKPWVFIDITPNSEGNLDCYIFGAPLIKRVSVMGIFKDPRQLEDLQCLCEGTFNQMDSNLSFIDTLVLDRLTQLKLRYYRAYQAPSKPNTQEYEAG